MTPKPDGAESVVERLRQAMKHGTNCETCGSLVLHIASVEGTGFYAPFASLADFNALLAAVEAAKAFCENSLERGPAPLTGDGREQPDNVWFVGSARDHGLPLMDALAALYDTPEANA